MALFYFSLGEDAERVAAENLGHYYAWLGEYAKPRGRGGGEG